MYYHTDSYEYSFMCPNVLCFTPYSNMATTNCECPPVGNPDSPSTAFSSGSTGPLVKAIDFSYLFANAGALQLESWIVWITELAIFIIYIVMVLYVMRKDKVDILKVRYRNFL